MPALCNRRGERRWRGQVKMKGKIVAVKWCGKGPKGGKEYRKALDWEKEQKEKLLTQPRKTHTTSLTVRKWGNTYMDEVKRKRSRATYVEVRTAFKFLGKEFGSEFPLERITPVEALKHLNLQYGSRSGSAANKDRKNLGRAWNWATSFMKGFPRGDNPFLTVDRFPVNKKPRYVPIEPDYWKVVAVAEGQDRVMLLTLFHLAARRGEIFRMTWADVDFEGERVQLSTRRTKDGSWRYDWVPMSKELKAQLQWWKENRRHKESEYVFTVTSDEGCENQFEGEQFKYRQHFMDRMCDKAGVRRFGFHAIRHLAAVILFHSGRTVAMIQAILRHQNPTTTEIYLKRLGLDPEQLKEAVKAFEGRAPWLPK